MINTGLDIIRGRIDKIARKIGVNPADITVVAAVKYVDIDRISEAVRGGIENIGENKVQEAAWKIEKLGRSLKWHMLGHLQTNKAKKAVEIFDLIQSLDSLRLAEAVDKHASNMGKQQPCLIEVNIGNEDSKFGVKPEELSALTKEIAGYKNISVQGLMTIAPYFEDSEKARPYFRRMKQLFDGIKGAPVSENISMKYLSMGMSGDFEAAIEEGSNMVRIGTALFGERTR